MDGRQTEYSSLSHDNDLESDFAQRTTFIDQQKMKGPRIQFPDSKEMDPRFDSGISSLAPAPSAETESLDTVSELQVRICGLLLEDKGVCSDTTSFNDSLRSDRVEKRYSKKHMNVEDSDTIVPTLTKNLAVQDSVMDEGYHSCRTLSSVGQQNYNENASKSEADVGEILAETDDDGDTLIHIAIVNREEWAAVAMINLLPVLSSCLNIVNKIFQTMLHLAVLTEQRKIVQKLVSKGCDLTVRDQQGNTALHIACRNGSEKLVKDMVGSLADNPTKRRELFSLRNCEGLTCLHLAAQGKHYEIMGYLFAKGADVNIGDAKSGRTILHYAVEKKDVETVVVLLTHPSIDIDCETYKGETPLLLAYWRNYQDIVKRLKANGAHFSYDLVENNDECDDS